MGSTATRQSLSPAPELPVLAVRSVSKTYAGAVPVTAVRDVTLEIHRGEMIALQGRSGSGKSTLLSLMGLLDIPSAGDVEIAGAMAAQLDDGERSALRASHLGFVFQQFHLIGYLDAVANVEAPLLFRGLSGSERRHRALQALERVGLAHRATHRPAQMSGGEQQRVAVARALVNDPAIVLADEPTGNLDDGNAAVVMAQLASLASDGVGVVLATHDPRLAASADRVFVLRDGRMYTR